MSDAQHKVLNNLGDTWTHVAEYAGSQGSTTFKLDFVISY